MKICDGCGASFAGLTDSATRRAWDTHLAQCPQLKLLKARELENERKKARDAKDSVFLQTLDGPFSEEERYALLYALKSYLEWRS